MTYTKPSNMKYTDMAIYIDKYIPSIIETNKNPEIEENIFKYLYLIFYALACKKKFFHKIEDYDGYSIYAAGQVYLLLRNQYSKHLNDPNSKPIKSSLNYVKSVLYAFKVNYQKQNFHEIIKPEVEENFDMDNMSNSMKESIQQDYREGIKEEIEEDFKHLPLLIKNICNQTPYSKKKVDLKNIYISCLLSFINNMSLPNNMSQKSLDKINFDYTSLNTLYNKEELNCIILWHLDESMSPYIKLLLNKVKKKFGEEIEDTKHTFDLDDSTLNDILSSAYATYDCNNSPEEE